MSYILYGVYNIAYQILTLWLLLMANTYFNDVFISNSFLWKDAKPREDLLPAGIMQTILLLIETLLLMLLMLYINRRFLSGIVKASNSNNIALWTAGIYSFVTIAFIFFLIYVAFK
jgi:hypothetical protein